jgi:hypothetical protein
MSEKGLFVFPTHQQVWDHNKIKLLEVNQSYPIAKLSAISKGVHANSMESDRADGLQKIIFLCKNAKVMLTTNLCVPFGLFNGATGTIIDLIYKNENRPENSIPDVDNNMDPKPSPPEMSDLTVIEQQLISRISPCINVHLLNQGGIGSSGHCVTFPQEVNEPAKFFPRLPKEIEVLKLKNKDRRTHQKIL